MSLQGVELIPNEGSGVYTIHFFCSRHYIVLVRLSVRFVLLPWILTWSLEQSCNLSSDKHKGLIIHDKIFKNKNVIIVRGNF